MQVSVVPSPLSPADADAVEELAEAAGRHDGVAPLNEHTLLRLHRRHEGDRHLLVRDGVRDGGRLAGYAFLDSREAELVVRPDARRHGFGTALARRLQGLAAPNPVAVWAHGGLDEAAKFAEGTGFTATRELFLLRRDVDQAPPLPDPVTPDGFEIRTFVPGRDDAAWLDVNARAFAHHPEQGAWDQDELADRLGQRWFDPAGFFLAEDIRRHRLAGFHWTKVHERPDRHGEVYVLGIDPEYQGTGLGKVLAILGLRYLHGRGLKTVELYVDGTNPGARKLYEKLGFREVAVDVQYTADVT